MSSLLERGNRAVDERLGTGASALLTRRVEPHRRGGVVWSLETDAGPRWFALTDDVLSEIRPDQDELLPLACILDEPFDAAPKVLTWRPGRRIVVAGRRRDRPVVVKGYRAGRSHDAARRHALVASNTATQRLRTACLIEHDETRACLILEHLDGAPPLLGRDAALTFYRIGDALRRFQDGPTPSDLTRHDRVSEVETLDCLARRVLDLCGVLPEGYAALRDALEACEPRTSAADVLVHGDLHDGQLLACGRELAWIDFDGLKVGEPALDIANLTAHLTLRGLQRARGASGSSTSAAASALLEGYDAPTDAAFTESLRFHQATTFLRLSLLYSLRPRWNDLPPILLTLAGKCLDDACRLT